jgi:hypothetical protein
MIKANVAMSEDEAKTQEKIQERVTSPSEEEQSSD